MQKIDFVRSLEDIVENLQSETILKVFQNGFSQPASDYKYETIIPTLFLSKSNFDQIKTNGKYSSILNSLNADAIYTESNLTSLTSILRAQRASGILSSKPAVDLFTFHATLFETARLAKEILINPTLKNELNNEENYGFILLQIVIEGEGLETEKYIKILTQLEELVSALAKVFSEDEIKSEVTLFDSGSDTNLGLKTGIETAKSLFLIFKEIWDYIINYKHYKQNQQNKTLLESLTIRQEIMNKVNSGVLTEDEGKTYIHIIKTRTDELIGMKVLPKKIVQQQSIVENKKLLTSLEGQKLLSASSA